jgi:hypothetical protein
MKGRKNVNKVIKMPNVLPADHEDPKCSSGIRCWVFAYFYGKSGSAVNKKMDAYYGKYPEEGYSTCTIAFPRKNENHDYWRGIIRRYSTCD